MKCIKRAAGLLLAVALAFVLGTAAHADSTLSEPVAAENRTSQTIRISGSTERTYAVYQIFAADYGNGVLSNLLWGANGTGTPGERVNEQELSSLLALLESENTDVQELATITGSYVSFTREPVARLGKNNPSSITLPTGYYLIKDEGVPGFGDTYSLHMVKVAGSSAVDITPKDGKTVSTKKVVDKNDSISTNAVTDWQDSADYDLNDVIAFQLKGTVAGNYELYSKGYTMTFHDRMASGLSFDPQSLHVYLENADPNGGRIEISSDDYSLLQGSAVSDRACTFEVRFDNLKAVSRVFGGCTISVEYNAKLNGNAVMGSAGNENVSYITYSNNPNADAGGPDEDGRTVEDTVKVFTYQLHVNKIEENPLYKEGSTASDEMDEFLPVSGAKFTLYKRNSEGTYEAIRGGEQPGSGAEQNEFSWLRLDDGYYKLEETTTPTGYNTGDPLYFVIEADHTVNVETAANKSELNGVPALNSLTVYRTTDKGVKLTQQQGGATVNIAVGEIDPSTGDIVIAFENKPGAALPATGGTGTTLFYVAGAALVIGAVILLVVRRRMNSHN